MTVEIRPLAKGDERSSFSCGDEELDLFFHRYAGQNQFRHHLGVTYIAVGDRSPGAVEMFLPLSAIPRRS